MLQTLATRVANWLPKFDGILFFSLESPTQGHKVQYLFSNLGQMEKIFYFFFVFWP
jgi:hypothetical protein